MKEKIIKNRWEYEIHEIMGEYGFRVDIFMNDKKINSQGGFGNINFAEIYARDYFLLHELNIEKPLDDN
jgi:hypothetical protein